MTVYFIGAGPGAADLITVRGQRLLSRCPVCLYAGSIMPEELLALCPADARVIDTGPLNLDQIITELADAHEAGRDVPGEVSVVGFDDIPVAAHVWPSLTTVGSDNAELAEVGLTYLTDFLSDPEHAPPAPPKHVHQMVIRNSTARPSL